MKRIMVGELSAEIPYLGKFSFSRFRAKRAQKRTKMCPQSVSDAKFSGLVHYFFLFFCMKLRDHKCRKVTEPDFLGKFSFSQKWAKRAQKGPKIGFLDFYAKLNH